MSKKSFCVVIQHKERRDRSYSSRNDVHIELLYDTESDMRAAHNLISMGLPSYLSAEMRAAKAKVITTTEWQTVT